MRIKKTIWLLTGVVVLLGVIGFWLFQQNKANKLIEEIQEERESDIVFGDPQASHNIILFFDYNCGFCRKFMSETYPQLQNTFLKENDVKLSLRLVCNPTDVVVTQAWQTATCLNKTGDFMKLHQLLLHKPEIIYTQHFTDLTDTFISTNSVFEECLVTSDNQDIKRNIYQFQQLKTKGTPTFVIGQKIVKGHKNTTDFKNLVESALN